MITEEHAKPPPIAVPSQVNHFSKFIYFQHVTQEEQGRAQLPLRRSDALAGRYSDDEGNRRHRLPARHFRARPHHRRQERACEFEGIAADLTGRMGPSASSSATAARAASMKSTRRSSARNASAAPFTIGVSCTLKPSSPNIMRTTSPKRFGLDRCRQSYRRILATDQVGRQLELAI